ncbi:hypothetical protein HA402_011079 [Bradysia odoriphaga]|nr:hypothetical protein HA402_011079 [Bradysia odoriphaga]
MELYVAVEKELVETDAIVRFLRPVIQEESFVAVDRELVSDNRKGKHSKTAGCSEFKKIIGQRTRGDKTYYKVQWKGQLLHTWELEENLDAVKVAEFKRGIARGEPCLPETKEKPRTGFQRGLEPKRIVGMYEVGETNTLMFKIEWKGCKTRDLVTADEAKDKCPQLVIAFYEKRISWV